MNNVTNAVEVANTTGHNWGMGFLWDGSLSHQVETSLKTLPDAEAIITTTQASSGFSLEQFKTAWTVYASELEEAPADPVVDVPAPEVEQPVIDAPTPEVGDGEAVESVVV